MSAAATPATPFDDPGPPAADTPYYRGVLHGMIDRGADLTRALHELAIAHAAQQAALLAQQAAPAQHTADLAPQAADAQPAPAPAPDTVIRLAASFDQIARAVRRSIALAQNLDAPKQQSATHPAPDRIDARKRILRAVEDVIQRKDFDDSYADCDSPEALHADFRERMDAPDLDDDIASRPVEDIVKDILRDLGIAALPGSRPWKRRTSADIAELSARAAAPSSPIRSAARPPGPGPQDGPPAAAAQRASCLETDQREPGHPEPGPPAAARVPVRPGPTLPEDPGEAVALIPHHHARTDARWRPPPGG